FYRKPWNRDQTRKHLAGTSKEEAGIRNLEPAGRSLHHNREGVCNGTRGCLMALTPEIRVSPFELIASFVNGTWCDEVYKAIYSRLNLTVVIKFLKGPEIARVEEQAKVLAALNNPFICPIYEVCEDHVVMEYVEGKPIGGPLSTDETIQLAGQILNALEAAHSKGIIHQGIRPGNI